MKLVLIVLLLLAGCADENERSGLAGANPVTRITYEILPIDTVPNFAVSINANGKVRFQGGEWAPTKGRRERQLDRTAFVALASDLAPFRVAPSRGRQLAEGSRDCLTDIGHQLVTWTYENGTSGRLIVTNCRDHETDELAPILISIPKRLQISAWTGNSNS